MSETWSRTAEGILTYTNVSGWVVLDSFDMAEAEFGQWRILATTGDGRRILTEVTATHNKINKISYNTASTLKIGKIQDLMYEVVIFGGRIVLRGNSAEVLTHTVYRFLSDLSFKDNWGDGGHY